MNFTTKQLTTIILFTSIGAVLSVPIGHIGNYLKTILFLPMGTGQLLAGLHLIMVALTAKRIQKTGTATITGLLKGLVEAVLFSFHGITVIAMSAIQGLIIDVFSTIFGYTSKIGLTLGCGFSALSNVLFIQFFIKQAFPMSVYLFMYALSFTSGIILGAIPAEKLEQMITKRTATSSS